MDDTLAALVAAYEQYARALVRRDRAERERTEAEGALSDAWGRKQRAHEEFWAEWDSLLFRRPSGLSDQECQRAAES